MHARADGPFERTSQIASDSGVCNGVSAFPGARPQITRSACVGRYPGARSHGFDTEFRGEIEQEYTCNEKGEYIHGCGEPSESSRVAAGGQRRPFAFRR
jgi:hypothetical protein